MTESIKSVGIVGAGVIGSSWAAYYLAKGFDVIVTDPAPGAESALRKYVKAAWPLLTRTGLDASAKIVRLSFTADMQQAVGRADFVQENGPERPDFKAELFKRMDEVARPEVILASSSSGLTMDIIQSKCARPERCVIGHPFNPPHIIPLVEVVGGAKTSQKTLDRSMQFYADIGKKPILLNKALPGHVANRLQAALYKEVLYLVQQGVLSIADADTAVCYGPGLRWGVIGPSLQWHLGGGAGGIKHYMEHLMAPLEGLMKNLKTPDFNEALHKTIIDDVLAEARDKSVEELSDSENEVLVGLLELRDKAGL